MALQNSWTYAVKDKSNLDIICVDWERIDDAEPKVLPRERGKFDYDKASETWPTSKTAIETKITNKDGQEM